MSVTTKQAIPATSDGRGNARRADGTLLSDDEFARQFLPGAGDGPEPALGRGRGTPITEEEAAKLTPAQLAARFSDEDFAAHYLPRPPDDEPREGVVPVKRVQTP